MERIEDLTAKAQQRHRQGRILDAIKYFEKALEKRIDHLGPEDKSVKKACEQLCDVLNGAALKYLQNEEYENARDMLQKAEKLTGPDDLVTSVTYNNMACYFRRRGKLRTALSYLEKAQRIEMKSRVVANPAGTRLNLCAVLSQLERHQEARDHAQAAVFLLQEELSRLSMDSDDGQERKPEVLNKMAVLAISYHNIGVEEEYLRRHAESLEAYQRGVEIARTYLGGENDITKTLVKSCIAAQQHLDASKQRKPVATPALNGPYEAMHQHNYPRRRAHSAGTQRSQTATPSWALNTSQRSAPPSASASRSRISSATTRDSTPAAHHFPLMRDSAPAASRRPASAFASASTKPDPATAAAAVPGRPRPASAFVGSKTDAAAAARQRPGSAFAVLSQTDRPTTTGFAAVVPGRDRDNLKGTGPGPGALAAAGRDGHRDGAPGLGFGGRRGPVTPRLDSGDPVASTVSRPSSGVRRPASASSRQPVRANLAMFQREQGGVREASIEEEAEAEAEAVHASQRRRERSRPREHRGGGTSEAAALPRSLYDGSEDLMLERPAAVQRGGEGRGRRADVLGPRDALRGEAESLSEGGGYEDEDATEEEELSIAEDKESSLSGLSEEELPERQAPPARESARQRPRREGERGQPTHLRAPVREVKQTGGGGGARGEFRGGGDRRERGGAEGDQASQRRGVGEADEAGRRAFVVGEAAAAAGAGAGRGRPARPSDTGGRGRGRDAAARREEVLGEESKYTSSDDDGDEAVEGPARSAARGGEEKGAGGRYASARSGGVRTPDGRRWVSAGGGPTRAAAEEEEEEEEEEDGYVSLEEDEEAEEVVATRGKRAAGARPAGGSAQGGGSSWGRSAIGQVSGDWRPTAGAEGGPGGRVRGGCNSRSHSNSLRDSELELSGSQEEEPAPRRDRSERERAGGGRRGGEEGRTLRGGREGGSARMSLADRKLRELRELADGEGEVEISADSGSESDLFGADEEDDEDGELVGDSNGRAKALKGGGTRAGEDKRRAESLKWVEFDLQRSR